MEKHIEVMAKDIEQARIKAADTTNSMNYGFGGWYAKELYEKGYRKAYDVAREIFEDIDEVMERYLDSPLCNYHKIRIVLAEIKKKYTESEDTE